MQNAIQVYEYLREFNPYQAEDLERAHKMLMQNLRDNADKLRTSNIGIVKSSKIKHLAPIGKEYQRINKRPL